jgi:hypothetical protein
MNLELRQLFGYFLDHEHGELPTAVVIDQDGTELGRHQGYTTECQVTLNRKVSPEQIRWSDDPANDPLIAAAWERRSAREPAPPNPAPRVPRPERSADLRARRAEQHLCHFCEKSAVCVVADAVRRMEALHPIVSGCGGFEPPPPRDEAELAEYLTRDEPG